MLLISVFLHLAQNCHVVELIVFDEWINVGLSPESYVSVAQATESRVPGAEK